jgi:hypothetical protein
VRGNIRLGAIFEGHRLRCFELRGDPIGFLDRQGISTIEPLLAIFLRALAGGGEADRMQRA